ncbi:MAG: PQQ-binding-like beta-propeller repeat protein [Gemmatimonadota bacterium]|jgi:quinoprotein glucose dehydrogenase
MQNTTSQWFRQIFAVALGLMIAAPAMLSAQGPGTENGQWTYLGGDAWHTRYTTADEITADNFEELTMLWRFDAGSFGPSTPRATPSYVDGKLITVTGDRRHVIALNPENGELLWSFTEPNTHRYEYSMRKGYGKGVAYADVPGRGGVVFITTPAFFLWALDADTGQPLEDWGEPIPLPGFSQTGGVDLVKKELEGWGQWERWNQPYDPNQGVPLELGYITSSSPPIVVNNTVVVGNSAEQGYQQTKIENIPGDILGYDAATGDFKWKFHVIPRPGEFGHDTWENDAWEFTGDVSSWAPMAADPELGLVYIVTNGVTIDYYGGFSPGDNLFSTSIIALDADTGERRWHYQMVHHDVWNYDTPTAPVLMDVNVDGREVKGIFQTTKQVNLYALDRETGEPIWPIEERPVPTGGPPGEHLSPTQPWPVPEAFHYDLQGRDESMLIDYTPEIREQALALAEENNAFAALFEPFRTVDDPRGPTWMCPGDGGGTNIPGPSVADPVNGIIYITSTSNCSPNAVMPADESPLDSPEQTGSTYSDWSNASPRARFPQLDGLDIWKGPSGRITAIDLNTAETLWVIPSADTPRDTQDLMRNHPLLRDLPNLDEIIEERGRAYLAPMTVTPNMLLAASTNADNEPVLRGIDKMTGQIIGEVSIPGLSRYGMSSWEHNGHQYIIIQLQDGLAAFGLPEAMPQATGGH